MKKNSTRIVAVLVVLLMLLIAGCGDGKQAGGPTAAPDSTKTAAPDTSGGGSEDPAASVRTDIVIGLPGDMTSLHPFQVQTGFDAMVLNQIYEPLWVLDATNAQFVFYLAESYTMSEDKLTCTIKLREGVTFQDGSPMTSEDVKFSYEQCLESPYRSWQMGSVASVEAPDDYTFVVKFKSPDVVFLSYVGNFYIVPSDYYQTAGIDTVLEKPVGTGAYEFVSYEKGYKIELKAFEGHWAGAPSIKQATYRIISDADSMLLSMQSGDVHVIQSESSLPASVDAAVAKGGITKVNFSTGTVEMILINMNDPLFQNKALRQAIGYAMDREFYVASAMSGAGSPAGDIAPPNTYASPYGLTNPMYTYDLEKAKALMVEAGYPDGLDIGEFRYINWFTSRAEIIQQNLAAIGITCELVAEEVNAAIQNLSDGNYGVSYWTMSAIPEYQVTLESFKGGATWNLARYANPEVDALIADGALKFDIQERMNYYAQVVDLISEDAPVIPLAYSVATALHNDKLQADQIYMGNEFLIRTASWME